MHNTDYVLPEDLTHRDDFTELVFTLRDEIVPRLVPVTSDFMDELAKSVVLFILGDEDMRTLMVGLLEATHNDGYGAPDD